MGNVVDGLDDQGDEKALDLVAGERYEGVSCRTAGVLVCPDDGEEGVREYAQGDQRDQGA
jgi:hypothetical protein